MGDNSLSVCVIAKNEEENISRCLGSVEHIADEIIVLDTGSTDNTIKIVKSFGAIVKEKPWNNDFSEARNAALDLATKKWILYLDADEMLDFQDAIELKDLLEINYKDGEAEGFCLNLINVVDGKKTLSCASLRVLRNRKEYRFSGRIHEQIFPPMKKLYGEKCVQVLDLKFYHYGYDKTQSNIENKIKRNLAIFNSYNESEKDSFFYYNLGNEYLRIGEIQKALDNYLKSNEGDGEDNGFRIFLPVYIVKAYYDLKMYDEGIKAAKKFLMSYPNYKDLHFIVAACYYDSERYSEAKKSILRYIEFSKVNYGYPEFYLNQSNDIDKLLIEIENKIKIQGKKK